MRQDGRAWIFPCARCARYRRLDVRLRCFLSNGQHMSACSAHVRLSECASVTRPSRLVVWAATFGQETKMCCSTNEMIYKAGKYALLCWHHMCLEKECRRFYTSPSHMTHTSMRTVCATSSHNPLDWLSPLRLCLGPLKRTIEWLLRSCMQLLGVRLGA